MAEFCLACWNRINKMNDPPVKYIFTNELELCEGCGEWKRVIITTCSSYYYRISRFILFPLYGLVKLCRCHVCCVRGVNDKKAGYYIFTPRGIYML